MIYNLYIYDRKGKCLFYKEWSRPLNTLSDDPEEEKKLMYGMLYSLKELTSKISPSKGPEGLHTVKTNVSCHLIAFSANSIFFSQTYTLHHFESGTGMTFIMNSDPSTSGSSSPLASL
jgi:trafficking protein particle complex subunit 1